MEIFERNGKWIWREKPGVQHSFDTKEAAHDAAGIPVSGEPDWKLHILEELPLPEVREYDSLEEAVADQDKDELDRFEDELIAEEN